MDRSAEAMFLDNFAAIRLADQQRLLAPGLRAAATRAGAYAASMAYFDAPNGSSTVLDRLLYADMKTYLVELLMKQDQMSMAASIESRVPFLDHKLVEFAARLPNDWKLRGWTTKRVLREAMKGLLPESILSRPKMGFPVPFAGWARDGWHDIVRDVLLDRRTRDRGSSTPAAVDQLLRDHAAGRTEGGDRIWSLLNLELWYRTFIDKQGIQTLPAVRCSPRQGGKCELASDASPGQRHEITYLSFAEPDQRERISKACATWRARRNDSSLRSSERARAASTRTPRRICRSPAVRDEKYRSRVSDCVRGFFARAHFDLIVCDFLVPL